MDNGIYTDEPSMDAIEPMIRVKHNGKIAHTVIDPMEWERWSVDDRERYTRAAIENCGVGILETVRFERETNDIAMLLDSGAIAWITNNGVDFVHRTGDPLVDCVEFETE